MMAATMRVSFLLLAILVGVLSVVHAERPASARPAKAPSAEGTHSWFTACKPTTGSFVIEAGQNQCSSPAGTPVAWGWFEDNIATTGWSELYIESNAALTGKYQSQGAGFLEGSLTAERMYQQVTNWWINNFNSSLDSKVGDFLDEQESWMAQNVELQAPSSDYWAGVDNIQHQLIGMIQGYEASDFYSNNQNLPNINFGLLQLQLLNLQGETDDIYDCVHPQHRIADYTKLGGREATMRALAKKSKCSALVMPSPDGQDIFMAHTTWGHYVTMLRVVKTYVMPIPSVEVPGTTIDGVTITFSSQPGLFYSNDDFYVVKETQMAIIETTNEIANDTLYSLVTPQSVPVYIRAQLANRLSDNGTVWSEIFQIANSGTYNNQWMILDSKCWRAGQPIQANSNLLWIVSQLPGNIESQDVSNYLISPQEQAGSLGYWASYNIPFFPDFYQTMGYPALLAEYGPYYYSYNASYRYELFARETKNISTIADMQRVMQLNRYQTDPLSKNSPEIAIAARYDLAENPDPFKPELMGGIDTKITSWSRLQRNQQEISVVCGPTKDDQQVFSWTPELAQGRSILGHPTTWNFPWVDFALDSVEEKKEHETIAEE